MEKDFRKWHHLKTDIDKSGKRLFFHEREIWFCHLGANIGSEENGRGDAFLRPVIVARKFNSEIFWAIPLARTQKEKAFYFSFQLDGAVSVAMLSQIRLVDARRLRRRIGTIAQTDFVLLKEKLKALLP